MRGHTCLRPGECRLQPVAKQAAVGQAGQLVVLGQELQAGVHLLALDCHRHLGRDEHQQVAVGAAIAGVAGIALQQQYAAGPERHADPVVSGGPIAGVERRLRRYQQRFCHQHDDFAHCMRHR